VGLQQKLEAYRNTRTASKEQVGEAVKAITRALGDPRILLLLAVAMAVLSYYSLRRPR